MAIYQCLLLCVGLMAGLVTCNGVYGRCNDTHFLTKAFGCEVKFFKAFASKDSLDNCSTLYKVHVEQCYNSTLIECFRDTVDRWQYLVNMALLTLEAFGNAQYYCSSEEINIELPDKLRKTFPCDDKYNKLNTNCTRRFRQMLAVDRSDPLLCSEYERSNNCTDVVAKQHCKQTLTFPEGLTIENPFCPAVVPPTRTPRPHVSSRDVPVVMAKEKPTASASTTILCKGLVWMAVTAIGFCSITQ